MKEFFKSFFASILALVIFTILIVLIIGGVFNSISKQFDSDKPIIADNSVLKLNTNYAIPEQTQNGLPNGLGLLNLGNSQNLGLNDLLANINKATSDDAIKGIYIELGLNNADYATLQELRDALIDFKKKSGKFIYAYGEIISQSSYYLASVADKIYLNPSGAIDFKGLSAEITFYKNALDRLGIQVQVFYVGKYKSATEPYRFDKMSEENRTQLRLYLDGLFNNNLKEIAAIRHGSIDSYHLIADSLFAWYPSEAVKVGLIDGLKYEDEVCSELKQKMSVTTDNDVNFVTMTDYLNSYKLIDNKKKVDNSKKIAIVYANGTIIDGESDNGYIGSKSFQKIFSSIRKDTTIKAVLLRVNSPGGSALASDVMWRELELTKLKIPIVVSMGTYAASGGYMISCNANYIFAQSNTLTGSIGVFLVVPEISKFMNSKLGVTFDTVKTATYSDFPSINHPFNSKEKQVLQGGVDSTYLNFKRKVANGRKMAISEVENIAQGRIWLGEDAMIIGLVDAIGGIDEALAYAANLVHLPAYKTVTYPIQEPSILESLFYSLTSKSQLDISSYTGVDLFAYLKEYSAIMQRPIIQTRLPFDLQIK